MLLGLIPSGVGSVPGKEEERQMFQQMQAMAQKQVLIISYQVLV